MSTTTTQFHWPTQAGLSILVVVAASAVLFPKVDDFGPNGDESGWIASAYYYTDLTLHLDLSRDKWDCLSCGPFGSLNMQLGKWLFGVPLKLYSQTVGHEFSAYYDWNASPEKNQAEGRFPPNDILKAARRVSVSFGVLGCLLLFWNGYFAAGPWTGLIAVSLLLTNVLFVRTVCLAFTDSFFIFFVLV